jgi:hypothetical protein
LSWEEEVALVIYGVLLVSEFHCVLHILKINMFLASFYENALHEFYPKIFLLVFLCVSIILATFLNNLVQNFLKYDAKLKYGRQKTFRGGQILHFVFCFLDLNPLTINEALCLNSLFNIFHI